MKYVRNYVIIPCAFILLIILTSTCTIIIGPSSQKSITAFSIDSYSALIAGSTIHQVVVPGTILTNPLIATFETTGVKVSIGSVEQVSGVTQNYFDTSKTYTVEAADGSTKDYTVTASEGQHYTAVFDNNTLGYEIGVTGGGTIEASLRFPSSYTPAHK